MLIEQPAVGVLTLLGHDRDVVEERSKPGPGDLALLVKYVSIRNQPQLVITRS
jgi:hypothetical protein